MTKHELRKLMYTTREDLNALIAETCAKIHQQLLPPFFRGSQEGLIASDFIYNRLIDLVAEADDLLHKRPAEVIIAGEDVYECPKCGYQSYKSPMSGPMRKFIKSEPLTAQQFVIADAIRALGKNNQKIAAIKLIRGTFLDDDGGYCPLREAVNIYDAIMGRSY